MGMASCLKALSENWLAFAAVSQTFVGNASCAFASPNGTPLLHEFSDGLARPARGFVLDSLPHCASRLRESSRAGRRGREATS